MEWFAILCWSIWNHRNAILHSNEVLSDAFLLERAASLHRDFIEASQVNLPIIDPLPQKIWKPSMDSSYKVNVDGSVSKVKGCVGVGMVVRD